MTWADFMSNWPEEGAEVTDGMTSQQSTDALVVLQPQHCAERLEDGCAHRAYQKIWDQQSENGNEYRYLEVYLLLMRMLLQEEYAKTSERFLLEAHGIGKQVQAMQSRPDFRPGSNSRRSGSHSGRPGSNCRSGSPTRRSASRSARDGHQQRSGSPGRRNHDQQRSGSGGRHDRDQYHPRSTTPGGMRMEGRPRSDSQSSYRQRAEEIRRLVSSSGTCHTCGKSGQLARDCRMSTCAICGRQGHTAPYCQRRSSERPRDDSERRRAPPGFRRSASGNRFRPGILERFRRSKSGSFRQNTPPKGTPGGLRPSSPPHHGRSGSQGRKSPGACHKCGKEGHWQAECPNTAQVYGHGEPLQDRQLLFCRNRRAVRAAHRLSHPQASRRNRAVKALHVDAIKILRNQQVFALDVCTVQLKDITEEVLRSPRRLKTATAIQAREMTAQTRLQFADGLQLPDLTITALADTGCEVAGVIRIALLRAYLKLLHSAKIPVILLTAGKPALAGGTQGLTVTLSLPVITPEGYKVFKCLNVFLHFAAVGPRLISANLFLLAFGLPVVPGQEALVQVPGCFKGFRVPRYQHGNLHAVQHSAPSLQSSELGQLTAVSTIEHESRADVPEATNADTQNAGVHLAHRVQFAPDVSCQLCVMCEDPCSRVGFLYAAQQPATCEQCGPVYTPGGVFNKRREGVRKNVPPCHATWTMRRPFFPPLIHPALEAYLAPGHRTPRGQTDYMYTHTLWCTKINPSPQVP